MYLRKCLVLVYGAMVIPFVGISADNVNVALHKPVIASSQQKEFPASNVTDGIISRKSSWTSAKGARTPHMLVLNLQKYYDIDRIVIYTGIPEPEKTEQEKGQAPGFWAMKNFKIQYWDDANWTDLPNTECTENRLDKIEFSPFSIRSSRVRCNADPEASVSKQPFLPQWQIISLSNVFTCPNSPENPDFPL